MNDRCGMLSIGLFIGLLTVAPQGLLAKGAPAPHEATTAFLAQPTNIIPLKPKTDNMQPFIGKHRSRSIPVFQLAAQEPKNTEQERNARQAAQAQDRLATQELHRQRAREELRRAQNEARATKIRDEAAAKRAALRARIKRMLTTERLQARKKAQAEQARRAAAQQRLEQARAIAKAQAEARQKAAAIKQAALAAKLQREAQARRAAKARQQAEAKRLAEAEARRKAQAKRQALIRRDEEAARQAKARKAARAKRLTALKRRKAAIKAARIARQKRITAITTAAALRKLTIASWGGAYAQAQQRAILAPFASRTGIKVKLAKHPGAGRELNVSADVINLGSASLNRACKSGAVVSLQDLQLAPTPNGARIADDLIAGARTPCGIAASAWSHVILVRQSAFKRRAPKTLAHVFDTKRYPGKRAFVKSPRYLLEMALMADGVPPADVYPALATLDGISRALIKIEQLARHIVWVDRPAQAYQLLRAGKVAISSAFSGQAFRIATLDHSIAVMWDGQILDVNYWAIPKTARNKIGAMKFLRYATAPKVLAATARQFPYGPMRRSAIAMTGRHAVLDVKLSPYLPTTPRNLRTALRLDSSWWAANEAMVRTYADPFFAQLDKASRARKKARSKRKRTKTARTGG